VKTYLKLAALAIVLSTPISIHAAEPTGAIIEDRQGAQQEPQRVIDPVEFFDKTTGKVKVWYWRAESGYEFYDSPGFHPRTGQALTGVTLDVITEWQQSQKNAKQCYIIQRDSRAPVIYRDRLPGIDPETGRECRLVTIGVVERLKEYAEGKRPVRIKAPQPEFFDPRTSEPIVWYVDHGGTIEIFDLMGYHPETSEELLPVTPEIVDRWKAQQRQYARKRPAPVDPDTHPFFDAKTGRPNIWHSPGENGALDFFDGPGFHPRTGKALTEITHDFADKYRADKEKERADRIEREKKERADREEQQEQQRRKELAKQSAAACDLLAANPNDQRRHSRDGVTYDQLKTQIPEAIRACELAVRLLPADLTLQYQLARAMELADPARGQAIQDRLVKLNYPAAFDNAGSLLLNDPKCRQHCIREAVKLFQKGAALGDPDAMMSLADQINNGQATGNMIALYQGAAKLGHPRAIRALEALNQERTPPPPTFRLPPPPIFRFPF
jgi:TPR repeat protein